MKPILVYASILITITILNISCQRREKSFPEQKDILYTKQEEKIDFQKLAQKELEQYGSTSKEIFIEEPGDIKGSYKKLTGNTWIFYFDKDGRILAQEKCKEKETLP